MGCPGYVRYLNSCGVVYGSNNGLFRPDQGITRAEVVTIVNRLLDRTADAEFIAANLRSMNTFTDLSKRHWAYYDVMEAANPHTAVYGDGEVWSR